MKINSLFEYAAIVQDRYEKRGEFPDHITILKDTANLLTEGYATLAEAEAENNVRFDPWGFEIDPSAVSDAVRFLKSQLKPEFRDKPNPESIILD